MFEKYLNLLQLIDYLGGSVDGRKKLQKLVYLIQHKGGPFQEVFQYHLYGPFSEQLANEIEEMKVFGLVRETQEPTSSGYKYRYSITKHGTQLLQSLSDSGLKPFKELIAELGQYDARDLELKATILFLAESNFQEPDIIRSIKQLKPDQNYSDSEIKESLRYLRKRGFLLEAKCD